MHTLRTQMRRLPKPYAYVPPPMAKDFGFWDAVLTGALGGAFIGLLLFMPWVLHG